MLKEEFSDWNVYDKRDSKARALSFADWHVFNICNSSSRRESLQRCLRGLKGGYGAAREDKPPKAGDYKGLVANGQQAKLYLSVSVNCISQIPEVYFSDLARCISQTLP